MINEIGISTEPYIPFTIDELIAALQDIKRDAGSDLLGDNFVVNAEIVHENGREFPPYTLVLDTLRGTTDPEKAEAVMVYVLPKKVKKVM